MDCEENDFWEIVSLLRSASPSPQVIERLRQCSHIVSTADNHREGSEKSGPKPFDESFQIAFINQIYHDPVLAVLGLRPQYLCSLLKRLLVEVEASGFPVTDELADAYGEALMQDAENRASSFASAPVASRSHWLYKTFAYGPTATTAVAPAPLPQECDGSMNLSGAEPSQPTCTPSANGPPLRPTLLLPLPDEVTRSHVAYMAAALRPQSEGLQDTATRSCDRSSEADLPPPAPRPPPRLSPLFLDEDGRVCDWQACHAASAAVARVSGLGGGLRSGEWGLISLHVSDNLLAGSTGCHEWEASFALAQWVLGHPSRFRGRRVLELGCGAGLVAVALHRAGAALVAATDACDAAVANCAANLRLNGVREVQHPQHQQPLLLPLATEGRCGEKLSGQSGVAVFRLNWEDPAAAACLNCDVAVASDVLYDPDIVPVFVALLAQLLRPQSGPVEGAQQHHAVQEAFIATLQRNPATFDLFIRSADQMSLHIESVYWQDSRVAFHHVAVLQDPQVVQRIMLHRATYRPKRSA